jgi:hypothetical protein
LKSYSKIGLFYSTDQTETFVSEAETIIFPDLVCKMYEAFPKIKVGFSKGLK